MKNYIKLISFFVFFCLGLPVWGEVEQNLALLQNQLTGLNQQIKPLSSEDEGYLANFRAIVNNQYNEYKLKIALSDEKTIKSLHEQMFLLYRTINYRIDHRPQLAAELGVIKEKLKQRGFDTDKLNNKALKNILEVIDKSIKEDTFTLKQIQVNIRYLRSILESSYIKNAALFSAEVERARALLQLLLSKLPVEKPPKKQPIAAAKKLSAATIDKMVTAILSRIDKKEVSNLDRDQLNQNAKRLHDDYFEALARGDMEQLQAIHTAFYKIYNSLSPEVADAYRKLMRNMLISSGFDSPKVSQETMRNVVRLEIENAGRKIKAFRKIKKDDRTNQQLRELQENQYLFEKLSRSLYFKEKFSAFIADIENLIKQIKDALEPEMPILALRDANQETIVS